jgi:hypothetical protein
MEQKIKFTEAELAEKFIQFFSGGYDVYPEVPAYGIIDIIAYRDPIVIAIECKMQFSFEVLEQAIKNKTYAHYSYIAIPKPKFYINGIKKRICNDYGIGVLTFREYKTEEGYTYSKILKDMPLDERIANRIDEQVAPKLNRKIIKPKLEEWMKKSIAGSQNDRMTAFKNTVEEIENMLIRKGKMKVEDALKEIRHHYGSISSAKSSLSSLCRSNVIKTFTIEGGYFKLKQSA